MVERRCYIPMVGGSIPSVGTKCLYANRKRPLKNEVILAHNHGKAKSNSWQNRICPDTLLPVWWNWYTQSIQNAPSSAHEGSNPFAGTSCSENIQRNTKAPSIKDLLLRRLEVLGFGHAVVAQSLIAKRISNTSIWSKV